MTEDPETSKLSEKLRQARAQADLTQEEVAQELKLHRQALSDIERGVRRVTAQELFRFAKLYGKPWEWFLMEEPTGGAEDDVLVFLRAAKLDEKSKRAFDKVLSRHRQYAELEDMAQEPWADRDFRPLSREIFSFEDCWKLADEERNRLGLGEAPGNLLQELLEEQLSIKVIFEELPESFSGASWTSCLSRPSILINGSHPRGRRNWTLAHEYFHLLHFSTAAGTNIVVRSLPGGESRVAETAPGNHPLFQACKAAHEKEQKPREEQLADQFAAAFLLPENPVRARVAELAEKEGKLPWADLAAIAFHFGVSMEALLWRLVNLKLLSRGGPEAYRHHPEGPGAIGKSVPRDQQPRSIRLERVASKLYLKGEISGSKLAEILRCDRADVETIVEKYRAPNKDVGEFTYRFA